MGRQQEYTETLTLTYESNGHRADAKAVGASLLAIEAMIAEVHNAFEENEQLLVKARPFGQGSLELPLDLIVFGAAMIIQEYPLFQKIREVIKRYFDIKRRLRGRPIHVEEGNVIIIENSRIQVDQITLQCLNPGSAVSDKCSDAFHDIEGDSEIQAVRILSSTSQEPLIRIPRREFPFFHPETPIGEQNLGQRYKETQETLIIRQPSFEAELAWRFIWRETKISAKVQDERFQRNVEAGSESFAAGDSLDVDLQRLQEYDPAARTYANKQYTITQVRKHNHHHRVEQGKLFE